jgi:hypothetical protein
MNFKPRLTRTPLLASLPPLQRRGFMKLLGVALAVPGVPLAVRHAARAFALGEAKAEEMAKPPINFIEIDLRDQWDFGHVFVAPGLATAANLKRGESGRMCAMYYAAEQLKQFADRRIYLTPHSLPLEPHLDTIAMIETCELGIGEIHGHEASNPQRSPGRSGVPGPGRGDMGANEPVPFVPGNQMHYSSSPTPAALHNHWIKQQGLGVKNGIAFKGISREHTAYHYGAGLEGSELDRKQTVAALHAAFPDTVEDYNVVPSPQQAEALIKVLSAADDRFLQRHKYEAQASAQHLAQLGELSPLLYQGEPKLISLPLTPEEVAYWQAGVPEQQGNPPGEKCNIWEQCAYAYKLIHGGQCATVALEYDYLDWHDNRPQSIVDTLALQTVLPLVRLIESLKAANLYENTLIALYTLDGGRAPAANSSGSEGKSGLMLAGGMIHGGYYGDVGIAGDDGDGHIYSYSAPDPATGAPLGPVTDHTGRLAGAHVWRTVMKALGIPDSLAASFPDTGGHAPMDWLLRS